MWLDLTIVLSRKLKDVSIVNDWVLNTFLKKGAFPMNLLRSELFKIVGKHTHK